MPRRSPSKPGPYLLHMDVLHDRVQDREAFPFTLPVIRKLNRLQFHPRVTFLVGENGTGKSTILEAIAIDCRLNPEGGSQNFDFSTRASHSILSDVTRIGRTASRPSTSFFLRAESFYNVATEIEHVGGILDQYGNKSLHERSHGESFFDLFQNRFRSNGLYLMDEPEAALSPKRQLEFITMMHDYVCRGSQFVIATHSPIIMAYPDACIYSLDGDQLREVSYQETDHYLITRGFLNSPQRLLATLMERPSDEPPADDDR